MKTTLLKRIGVLSAVLAFASSMLFASPAAAAITTIFDLNGTYFYSDTVKPVITRTGDLLRIDMSSQGDRPVAHGTVIDADTIMVTFADPDETVYGQLYRPGTIRWSNGSAWVKMKAVPNVRWITPDEAVTVLVREGFTRGTVTTFPDLSCDFIGLVGFQTPRAGTLAVPGSRVNLRIGAVPPQQPCP
jgi:hypothetical protein